MKSTQTLLLSLLFFWIAIPVQAYTERDLLQQASTLQHLESVLLKEQKWVPYPAYTDRTGWDNLLKEYKETFIRQGEKKLNYEWKVVPATAYLEFEKSGNRHIMESPFNSNNQTLAELFMAELAEGKGRFIDQLINGVYHTCEMTSWALSAHLGREQVSRHSLPDHKKHIIDLTVGDLGSLLSWIYYYFQDEFDAINPVISERLRQELQERILDAYMNNDTFWWMAFNYKPGMMVNNWNPWCNFNMLQCFLLLEKDPAILTKAVYRSMVSVDKFINYTHSDGACEEGPSYWGHAAGKMYDYLQLLYNATDGKISLFDQPIIKNMGEYIVRSYVGDQWVVNFADASAKGGGDAAIIFRYGKAVNSELMMQYAAYINQSKSGKKSFSRDVFRTLQTLLYDEELKTTEPVFQTPSYTWYPETEFCYMSNPAGFFFAAKGGYNNESHNHNDAGSFSLYLNSSPVFIDAGVGTYQRQTFSSERYSIWTMQSNYHNIPMINGVPQAFGSNYKAVNTTFNPRSKTFSTDISPAYPAEAHVKKWTRQYTLGEKALTIRDNYQLAKNTSPHLVNFLTWGTVDCSQPGKITVEVNGEKVCLSYNKNDFKPTVETVSLTDPRLSTVWGEEIYRITLTATGSALSGSYTYTIQSIK